MSKNRFPILFLFLFIMISLAACQPTTSSFECADSLGCVTIAPDEPVELAALQVLSGEVAPAGLQYIHSIEMAHTDRDGQLLGHPIELQSEDELCTREGGSAKTQKIINNPQIIAILGTTCSGAAVPAAKIMSEAGLVMISGGYTRGLTHVFEEVFTELGGEITLKATINKGDTDMGPVLTAVVNSGPELLFFPIFPPEGNLIIKQTREIEGFDKIDLMAADGLFLNSVVEDVGLAGQGMYFVGPSRPESSAYTAFNAAFEAQYGQAPNPPFHGFGYDATNLLLNAIEAVAQQKQDGSLHIGRQALRDHLYATSGFEGGTGKLTCDKFGDCGVGQFSVTRLDDPVAGFVKLVDNVLFTYMPDQ